MDTKKGWIWELLQHLELKAEQCRNWDRAVENQFGLVMGDSWAAQSVLLDSWKKREVVGWRKEEEQRQL